MGFFDAIGDIATTIARPFQGVAEGFADGLGNVFNEAKSGNPIAIATLAALTYGTGAAAGAWGGGGSAAGSSLGGSAMGEGAYNTAVMSASTPAGIEAATAGASTALGASPAATPQMVGMTGLPDLAATGVADMTGSSALGSMGSWWDSLGPMGKLYGITTGANIVGSGIQGYLGAEANKNALEQRRKEYEDSKRIAKNKALMDMLMVSLNNANRQADAALMYGRRGAPVKYPTVPIDALTQIINSAYG